MKPIDLALKYMEVFYESGDWEFLYEILDTNLKFIGPLFKFNNARDYVESLINSPPIGCSYQILYTFESEKSVCLIYEYSKRGITTLMSQSFWMSEGKIFKIILIFNARDLM